MKELDYFFSQKEEPVNSCLIALKTIILSIDPDINLAWKYGMPFFCYHKKMFCYLWVEKSTGTPYIGFVEGKHMHNPNLIQEKRARMKVLKVNPNEDIDIENIRLIVTQAIDLYKNGIIKISLK